MLKPIVIMYPVIPARDEEERAALRPIGRNRDRYQAAIRGMGEIIQAADDMGFWGAATPEHHFWSEGYEVAPSPGATNAYWLAKTKNIHIGPLGYVMSTHNPIRVAEEVAVIDHLSQGRTFVGFARGYNPAGPTHWASTSAPARPNRRRPRSTTRRPRWPASRRRQCWPRTRRTTRTTGGFSRTMSNSW